MKKEEPILVAVHCLVYNHEPYLRDCLNGFVMQKTDFRFVAIVHDDVSTDKSAEIIREYAERYPDIIKPIFETENQWSKADGSLGRIMSAAIDATGAKYVAWCEGDDYWTDSHKLQKQVDFMEAHPETGLCYTDYNQQSDMGNTVPSMFEQQKKYRPETYEQHLLKPGYLAPMTWLYRKDLLHHFNQAAVFSDGTYAYMLEFMYNSQVAYLPLVTATYREHMGSVSTPVGAKNFFNYTLGVFKTQCFYAEKYPCTPELKRTVYLRGYLNILPIAVMADKEDFINEARTYMDSQVLDISLIIRELKQGEIRRRSKAYRIGKAILTPFKWMKR